DAMRKMTGNLARQLERKTAFANTARAGDGEQSSLQEQRCEAPKLLAPANKATQFGWQVDAVRPGLLGERLLQDRANPVGASDAEDTAFPAGDSVCRHADSGAQTGLGEIQRRPLFAQLTGGHGPLRSRILGRRANLHCVSDSVEAEANRVNIL